jgi:hypothetical protein
MKTKILLTGLGLVVVLGGLLVGDWGSRARGAGDREAAPREVTKDPAILISPTIKAGELSVYGLRLGDSTEKMPGDAGVSAMEVPERPQDMIYVGRNVRYYANDKRIYRITVTGDLVKRLPTYDAARLQMAMGKADESVEIPADEDTRLSYFARHVRYTVHAFRTLSLVTEVDLYAP